MILHLNTTEDFKTTNALVAKIKDTTIIATKKEKTKLQVVQVKVRLFIWNLSPIHWYDTFKEIHIDMNEFIYPKNKK